MKPFCSRALLLHRNSKLLLRPTRFLQFHHFSTAPSGHSSYGNQRRQEEESRNVRVSVWWDFCNCGIPAGANDFKIAHAITTALRTNGMKGPVHITAFGDVSQLSRNRQQALSSSGINLVHIPNGVDRFLLVDLLYWISQNPPPAHLFLISGDKDFAGILHKLRMSNYNILLASRDNPPAALCCAASITWQWSSLVKGEDFHGKLYNQPPDGPYNSWYGQYRRPLEDPFATEEKQKVLSKAKDVECLTDPKMPSIKTVLGDVRQILGSHHKGISIKDLEDELRKLHLCKDYYGYTTITQFLEAIPHIAELKLQSDGTYMVQPVTGPIHGPSELDVSGSAEHVGNKEVECKDDLNVRIGREPDSGDGNEKRSSESSQELIAEENSKKVEKGQDPKHEEGVVRNFWKIWFGFNHDVSNIECEDAPKEIPAAASVKYASSEDKSDKGTGKERVSYDANASNSKALNTNSDGSANTEQASAGSEKYGDTSETRISLFQRVLDRCMFWKVDEKPEVSSEGMDGTVEQEQISHAARNEIFSKDGFWSEMKSFLESPTASVVFQSTTRAAMSENLQKVGPECLKTLSRSELLHLVDLLISEKEFVKEQPFLPFPFKLAKPVSFAKVSLTSLFKNKQHGGEKKPDRGYSHHVSDSPAAKDKKGPERPRDEILSDCEKLMNEVVKKFPDGYNTGLFRRAFLEKYGYPLDINMLGYERLLDLLQIFPGVDVNGHIVRSSSSISKTLVSSEAATQEVVQKFDFNVGSYSLLKKQDEDSSGWEELGPETSVAEEKKDGYYEPVVIEDEFSESEDERRQLRKQSNSYPKKPHSALLEFLGSWDDKAKGSGNGNESVKLSVGDTKDGMIRHRFNKPRHDKKVYSFVADDKQKLKITTPKTESKKIAA